MRCAEWGSFCCRTDAKTYCGNTSSVTACAVPPSPQGEGWGAPAPEQVNCYHEVVYGYLGPKASPQGEGLGAAEDWREWMNTTYNGKLTSNSRTLRKNMTKEERRLWYDCLKQLPVTVHRQKVLGNYIVDFYIASCKIVIELDGSQHYEDAQRQKDLQRDDDLQQAGYVVLRYSNADVNQRFSGVCDDIWNHI